jgi:hypothetical protein
MPSLGCGLTGIGFLGAGGGATFLGSTLGVVAFRIRKKRICWGVGRCGGCGGWDDWAWATWARLAYSTAPIKIKFFMIHIDDARLITHLEQRSIFCVIYLFILSGKIQLN